MQGEARRCEIRNCVSVMTACFSPDERWGWFSTKLVPPKSIHTLLKGTFLKIITANAQSRSKQTLSLASTQIELYERKHKRLLMVVVRHRRSVVHICTPFASLPPISRRLTPVPQPCCGPLGNPGSCGVAALALGAIGSIWSLSPSNMVGKSFRAFL